MRYQEYNPSLQLAQWIQCYWFFEGCYETESWETVVADGYPELIIHCGSAFVERGDGGIPQVQPHAVLAGQLTRPLELRSLGHVRIAAVRFQPAGVAAFVNEPMRMLTDARVSAAELIPGIDRLADGLARVRCDLDGVDLCEQFLQSRLCGGRPPSPVVDLAIARIRKHGGDLRIADLAAGLDLGRRRLEQAFLERVGISPKQFCRVVRFRNAYDMLTEPVSPSAAAVAVEAGFFDQSHLIRDFRQFAGDPPEAFLQQQSPLAHALATS